MDQGSVKIFTTRQVPRLDFIAGIIFGNILGLGYELVTDKRKIGKSPVINYSDEELKGSFRIIPHELLFETGIREQDISVTEWNGHPVFFETGNHADFPFDIFAASFYLVSRYEEYLPHKADEHGRFPGAASLAARNGFLMKPVVDTWAHELARAIIKKFPTLAFRKNTFSSLVTIDVDQPFEYLGKDVLRNIGGLFRDFSRKDGKASERYRIVTKGEKDPWDVFDFITGSINEHTADARFFFPMGDKSKYDRNPSWQNEDYRKLIRKLSSAFDFGLHPSYSSGSESGLLKTELKRLRSLTTNDINSSRFHYLLLNFPDSYRYLLASGIVNDFSLGFHDLPGFRAGIARPFRFFDLVSDHLTDLVLTPFQFMDATLYQYMKLDCNEAGKIVNDLISETARVGGNFVSIWHNTSLLDLDEWQCWRSLFVEMLKKCRNDNIS
ncbi:MAG: polysaccharide deacetylase family protein [Bacteroidales bacterium]